MTTSIRDEPAQPDRVALEEALAATIVRVWRIHLETPEVLATVPMLRGVWGRSLLELHPAVYDEVFVGGSSRIPRYWLRPAPVSAQPAPAVEFALFGPHRAIEVDAIWAAWDRASTHGLGTRRVPFVVREVRPLAWDGSPLAASRRHPGFPLAGLPPSRPDLAREPSRIETVGPLRLLRRGVLVQQPSFPDLVFAALNRLQALAGPAAERVWNERDAWLDRARGVAAEPWAGRRLDFIRYSGSQKQQIDMHGIHGHLGLPHGTGPELAPLFEASAWLHLGKGTVFGLGQMEVRPLASG